MALLTAFSSPNSLQASVDASLLQSNSLQNNSLPDYLIPLPGHIAVEDADYLRKKGALSIPETEFRDALLCSYINFVHPTLPLLDLHDFVTTMNVPSQLGQQLSLLLFQAVMFAGSAWVDVKLIRRQGYLTRKAARKALFQKVRVGRTSLLVSLRYLC